MIDVGRQKQIRIKWKFFSLKLINEDREVPEDYKILHEIGLKALRVAAAVRRDFGNDAVGKIYTAMGARYHHDGGDIDEPSALQGWPPTLRTGHWMRTFGPTCTRPLPKPAPTSVCLRSC
jgi:hypothetical protein